LKDWLKELTGKTDRRSAC